MLAAGMRRFAVPSCLAIALGWLGAAEPSRAADLEVSAAVTVASDYFFRGISQTCNQPALQATVGVEHPSGWFGGVFASNVDFPEGPYSDQRNVELDAHLGYGRELGAGWAAVARAARYARFRPGLGAGGLPGSAATAEAQRRRRLVRAERPGRSLRVLARRARALAGALRRRAGILRERRYRPAAVRRAGRRAVRARRLLHPAMMRLTIGGAAGRRRDREMNRRSL
jgi:hypothetical protein